MEETLDTREDCGDIVRWTPSVLKDVQTEFAIRVHVRVKHPRQEFDGGRFVWVAFVECEVKFECAIFERGVGLSICEIHQPRHWTRNMRRGKF